jgi:hypothetical protein
MTTDNQFRILIARALVRIALRQLAYCDRAVWLGDLVDDGWIDISQRQRLLDGAMIDDVLGGGA